MHFSFLALSLLTSSFLLADLDSHTKYGLAPLQEHEIDHLENHVHKVIEVEFNHMGLERMGLPLLEKRNPRKEFATMRSNSKEALSKMTERAALPSSVDNSRLPSFPPIGDQGDLGSCVAWASTYYQATHEIGFVHGWDNKKSANHILSPKWTYNLINEGKNSGSSPVLAYQLLSASGAPSILDFPYDHNYTSWDLHSDHWISALFNRMGTCTLIPGLGGGAEAQNLTAIKQALNNGHVLTLASFIDSWVFTTIKKDPQNPHAPHVGEYAASWMNGTEGGHFMTIVGYDDNLWIDINENGQVDPGERGAFLIANSWGTHWGNQGFIWISYDAFLQHSAVLHGPSHNRVPAGNYLNSCLIAAFPKEANYTPRLVAEITLSQAKRDQINLQTGVSTLHENSPHFVMNIPVFSHGGSFEFDGMISEVPETATFAFDLTDFVIPSNSPQRYYLLLTDTKQGNPTTLSSFSLLDLVHHQKISSQAPLPKSYDNESGSLYIDYSFNP